MDVALVDARRRTRSILSDLAACRSALASGWQVPLDPLINPPLWEYGHLGWFAEWWTLRDARPERDGAPWIAHAPSRLADADRWFDSARVAHDARWTLDLPTRDAIEAYAASVLDATRARLADADGDDALEPFRLALFHEDMHGEALIMMRQALDYPAPPELDASLARTDEAAGTIACDGATFVRGADSRDGFAFDNEKPSQPVVLSSFTIDAECVPNRRFADFVADGGYRDARWWSDEGRRWLDGARRGHPVRWRREGNTWTHRWFGRWETLPPDGPVCHVNAFEAEACAAWMGRRLPREVEWEWAATHAPAFRWGDAVWEWTSDPFRPHPGFRADRYREYSQPWFETHRTVRGASFATHTRMRHPRYRNFYVPSREDLFVGFRTAADA